MEAELGLAAAALGDELRDGVAGNAAAEEAVEDGTAEGASRGGEGAAEDYQALWAYYRHCYEKDGQSGISESGNGRNLN